MTNEKMLYNVQRDYPEMIVTEINDFHLNDWGIYEISIRNRGEILYYPRKTYNKFSAYAKNDMNEKRDRKGLMRKYAQKMINSNFYTTVVLQ